VSGVVGSLGRLLGLLVIAALSLQLYFLARVGAMAWLDPQSTAYQRSEAWRLATQKGAPAWSHEWLPSARISANLKRAVIASEDAGFSDHSGVEWDALEKAWERNQKAEAAFALHDQQVQQRVGGRQVAPAAGRAPKIVGGSTITQQLAKNLFLGGERSLARKGQEFVVTTFLEALLSKDRILEIYLNSVEWGEGVFGAEAAARRYFRKSARDLTRREAALLATALPNPFRRNPGRPTVRHRALAERLLLRMAATEPFAACLKG
jgi:monofunctional glycosyltransferase